MKKIYLLAIAAFSLTFAVNAQIIDDNIDSYSVGAIGPQAAHWTTWSGSEGGPEDGIVSTEVANSGSQSMLIAEGGTQDVLLLLGGLTSGVYSIRWQMYVVGGKTGFWNIQESETPGVQWNGQYFIGATGSGGAPGVITHDQTSNTVPYLENFWFPVTTVIDLDNLTITVEVDGNLLLDNLLYEGTGGTATALGAINFFSIDANNRYFVDDVLFQQGNILSTSQFEKASFSVYPNPVSDILNIKSQDVVNNVSVYNVLGKLVYQNAPNRISPTVNMANFKSGIYFVEVTIGNTTKTVKVIR